MRNKMFHAKISSAVFIISLFMGTNALAGPKDCDTLSATQKKLAQKIMDTQHPYACCDETISKCITKKNPCDLAVRLANRICTRVAKGDSEVKIVKRLEKRAQSMMPQKKANIDTSQFQVAGQKGAPVKVVVYACTTCPFCSKLVPQLYNEVVGGKLKGKVELHFKPFPLKSHEYSKEGGLAIVAANQLGHYWDHILRIYKNFDTFSKDKLAGWAELDGMNKQEFSRLMKDSTIRKILVDSKKEGLANGVKATPQLFINGRKYAGFLDIDELVDVMQEEFIRKR